MAGQYDKAAPGWADKMRVLGYFDAYREFLSRTSNALSGTHALDIGCGTGAFAEARAVVHGAGPVTLLDPSDAMLQQACGALARQGVDAHPVQARLEAFNPDRRYECLLAAHVLEHCVDPVAALRHMHRLATPGAPLWLVVSKPHWCNAIIWFQWRHRTYRPGDVAQMLAAAGWALQAEHSFASGPPSRTSRGYLAVAV